MKKSLLILLTCLLSEFLLGQNLTRYYYDGFALHPTSKDILSTNVKIVIDENEVFSVKQYDENNSLTESYSYTLIDYTDDLSNPDLDITNYTVLEDAAVIISVSTNGEYLPQAKGFRTTINLINKYDILRTYEVAFLLKPVDKLDGIFSCWELDESLRHKGEKFFVNAENDSKLFFYEGGKDKNDIINLKFISDGLGDYQNFEKEFKVINHHTYTKAIVTYFSRIKTNKYADFRIKLYDKDVLKMNISSNREYVVK